MEIHHILARHHIAGLVGDPAVTAFSALPGAPVQPDRPHRLALRMMRRFVGPVRRRRRPVAIALVHECRPLDAPGTRMAA